MTKGNRVILISYLLLQMAVGCADAQLSPIVGKFNAFENNGKIYLNWKIIAGSTCNGIQIFRSVDSVNFTEIGSIPGVCGSTSFEQPYDFTDCNPVKNKINYYRLGLGGSGLSEILPIEIIHLEAGNFQIRPNPIIGSGKIYFSNERKELHQLLLFNQSGVLLLSLKTALENFDLDASGFYAGVYTFVITDAQNSVVAKGKLVVQH